MVKKLYRNICLIFVIYLSNLEIICVRKDGSGDAEQDHPWAYSELMSNSSYTRKSTPLFQTIGELNTKFVLYMHVEGK